MGQEEKGFVIKDKRVSAQPDTDGDTQQDKARQPQKESKEAAAEPPESQLPEINFSTFIMSLNASALVNLGLIQDPLTGKNAKNLQLGKQTVDMLSMLEEKTKGNLTPEEEKLLQGILYDLKIAYVRQKG